MSRAVSRELIVKKKKQENVNAANKEKRRQYTIHDVSNEQR